MTVTANTPVSGPHVADGVNRDWQFDWKVDNVAHMALRITDADGSNEVIVLSGFTIDPSYLDTNGGGYVHYPVAPTAALLAGQIVYPYRVVPYEQPTQIGNQGGFFPRTHERAFDFQNMQIQQLKEITDRALVAPVGVVPPTYEELLEDIAGASTSADNAHAWAQEDEDVAVDDGEHAVGFSAFHWARKALASAASALAYSVAAAASAASVALPNPGVANTFLQRNAGNTQYDAKTSTEVRQALVSAAYVVDRTAVKALDPTKEKAATTYGEGLGRNGTWVAYLTASLSAKDAAAKALDTAEGMYFTSGAYTWVRLGTNAGLHATWFGAVGDGVTVDTAALAAGEAVRASLGSDLVLRQGDYLSAGTAINRANGGGWRGVGNVRLLPNADSVILLDLTGAVVSSTLAKVFHITGIEFNFNAHASVTGIRESGPYYTHISHCKFNRLQFSAIFTGPNTAQQTGWININDVDQVGEGSWFFRPFDDTKYLFNVNINNFNQQGTGAAPWTGVNALFHFQRTVSAYLNNVNAASLDGGARGVYMQGDCQGIFLNNVIIGWPTYGVHAVTWTDGIKPAYVYMNNVGMDQPTVSGFDINGRTWRIHNANSTNGYLRGSTGPGINIQATATDITIRDTLIAYMNHDGFKVNAGATKVILAGITSENNDQIAGGNFDVNLTSCSFVDVVMEGRSYIGAKGVNATGQRVVNGRTSSEVSRNTGSASTTAVTTQEDLMTYSIPANTLKVGQKVRLTAWGTTAANANTKTVRLWFGANSVIDHSGTWNATPWRFTADIVVLTVGGAATQEYYGVAFPTALVQTVRQGTAANADNVAITVKCTGQNGTAAAGDIVCQGFTVEILD